MTTLNHIENREKNIRLELYSGLIALALGLWYVFSHHVGNFYQIYYIIVVFATHQINQLIIFNRWNFETSFTSKKILLRLGIIVLVLVLAFMDLGIIDSHFSFNLGFRSSKRENTFISIVIYCFVYLLLYTFGLYRINKKKPPIA